MALPGTMVRSENSDNLEPADEIIVAIGGQGASRHTLDHLLRGRAGLLLVETDATPSSGLPTAQRDSILRVVERELDEQYYRSRIRKRAVFLGQSRGVMVGRTLAQHRPDLFKGGVGIGGACRNLRDIKPQTKTLMEFIARSQLLATTGRLPDDEIGLQQEWTAFADLASRPMHSNQLYVSIYLDGDGDEVFHQRNCVSTDPNHLNVPVPPPDASDLAHLLTTSLTDILGLPASTPLGASFYGQMLNSPLATFWLGTSLEFFRSWQVCAPRTSLHDGNTVISGWESQRIPINHTLVGLTRATLAAARRGLDELKRFPD